LRWYKRKEVAAAEAEAEATETLAATDPGRDQNCTIFACIDLPQHSKLAQQILRVPTVGHSTHMSVVSSDETVIRFNADYRAFDFPSFRLLSASMFNSTLPSPVLKKQCSWKVLLSLALLLICLHFDGPVSLERTAFANAKKAVQSR
jgi:hypothetical protein